MKVNILLSFAFLLIVISCSKEKKVITDWDKAAAFVKYHSSQKYLINKDQVFYSTSKTKNASGWVEYFFSIYSTRNWVYENDEYAQYIREPKIPNGIILSKNLHSENKTVRQLVISADDENSQIIVEGFENINNKVFQERWEFPYKN